MWHGYDVLGTWLIFIAVCLVVAVMENTRDLIKLAIRSVFKPKRKRSRR